MRFMHYSCSLIQWILNQTSYGHITDRTVFAVSHAHRIQFLCNFPAACTACGHRIDSADIDGFRFFYSITIFFFSVAVNIIVDG